MSDDKGADKKPNGNGGDKKTMHVIIDDKCIDCGVCGNVCPVACITDQFDRIVPKKKITERPRPVIDKVNCTGCTYCVDYCPENCLEMTGDGNIQVSKNGGHDWTDKMKPLAAAIEAIPGR